MRLLVIEDNATLSELLAKGLRTAGYEVDLLATAAEARAVLMTTTYAAVILDLGLPDGDGLSILRELRHRKDPTPVLVLTARGGLQDRVSGLRSGADDYMVKPFALEELVARLEGPVGPPRSAARHPPAYCEPRIRPARPPGPDRRPAAGAVGSRDRRARASDAQQGP